MKLSAERTENESRQEILKHGLLIVLLGAAPRLWFGKMIDWSLHVKHF